MLGILLTVLFVFQLGIKAELIGQEDLFLTEQEKKLGQTEIHPKENTGQIDPDIYLQPLESILALHESEDFSSEQASLILLENYSQEREEDLLRILKLEQHPESMDQEERNLVYFYHLILDFLEINLGKESISKKELRHLTLSNQLVDHLEGIFQQEQDSSQNEPKEADK